MKSHFSKYHLNNKATIITDQLPGKESLRLLQSQKELEGSIVSYPIKMPIALRRAKGAIVEDVDGNQFIDFFSFAGVLNIGHCNIEVTEFIKEQLNQLVHALDFPTENKLSLISQIIDEFPKSQRQNYKVSFCGPTGSDAVEAAIKLAKHKTGRNGIIAFHGSYHGMTAGSLAATSNINFREGNNSSQQDVHYIPYSYCYRCPFNREASSCNLECAEYLKNILENPHSGISKPAAILLEPIQGEGGSIVPRDGYLERLVNIAHENGVLVIFDEIQSGFFRTGAFMASDDTDTFADIYTLSKGLGGIGLPISAIVYKKSIESWGSGYHVGTFRGNQLSIAAGRGAFNFIYKHHIQDHTKKMGGYLITNLKKLESIFLFIGEVRGKGLMIGIEYVEEKHNKKPAPQLAEEIRKICFSNGLLFEIGGHYSNVIRFLPPLIVTKEIIDSALEIFISANKSVAENLKTSTVVFDDFV